MLSTYPAYVKVSGRIGNRAVVSNAFTAKPSYDVFLSYNSADHGVVEDVARKLRDEGLEPFLDRWYLAPGARWRSKLEDTLSLCKAVAIFVGPGEMGSWQQREVDVALDFGIVGPPLPRACRVWELYWCVGGTSFAHRRRNRDTTLSKHE